MRFGCFGYSHQIPAILQAGFDSVEMDFCELTDMSELDYLAFYKEAINSGLGFEVFSGLLPLTERFHSPDFNLDYWLTHTAKGAARAAELGCRIIPFGAGKCRSIPDGYSPALAADKVASIVRAFSQVLSEYNIELVIEPLGPPNSNFLNTLPEVNTFLTQVNHPNCSSMCDLRHMHKSGEALSNLTKYRDIVKHAHIDYPRGTDRFFPAPDDSYDYLPYLKAILDSGYQGLLTVEATVARKDFATEAAACLSFLHELSNKLL